MSEAVPRWVGNKGFITALEWSLFTTAEQQEWIDFATQIEWLLDQPQFRNVVFTLMNEERFWSVDRSPVRATVEETYRAVGIQDAGRIFRLVLQSVAPRKWMKAMHEAFNKGSRTLPDAGGKE